MIAVVPAHQLTPFAIIGQLVVLAIVGRFRGRALVLVAIVAVAVYVLIAARDFWLTQLSLLTGSDNEGSAVASGILDRLTGDTGQVVVKLLRIIVPGMTWLLAIAGAWVYWRRRHDLVPIGLAVVPMAFAAQGYGGEVFLRIVLFGLPILAILGADALRALVRRRRKAEYWLAAGMVLLFGSIILIRGGNEAYMIVYPDEVEMTRQAYAATPPGLEVLPLISVGPYSLEGVAELQPRAEHRGLLPARRRQPRGPQRRAPVHRRGVAGRHPHLRLRRGAGRVPRREAAGLVTRPDPGARVVRPLRRQLPERLRRGAAQGRAAGPAAGGLT